MTGTLKLARVVTVLLCASGSSVALEQDQALLNPYERLKNGPPLTNVFHKVRRPSWFLAKIGNPMSHPAARMPDLKLEEDEVIDIMAYLKSIADPDFPKREWPAWADKGFEEMDDDELEAVLDLSEKGRAVWGNARCSIGHAVNGPGGERIGGFVDLRVGGIDLMAAGPKLKRDWLYQWIQDPKRYFPGTLMPHFRFSQNDLTALIEFIMRDDSFQPLPAEDGDDDAESAEEQAEFANRFEELGDPQRVRRGKNLIELARCIVCHDIEGIPEVLTLPERQPTPPTGGFEFLAYDLRCLSCHTIEQRGGTYAPDLTGEGSRLKEAWIAQFVESPDMVRPLSQQMPKFNLTAEDAKIIAAYFSASRHDTRIPEQIPGGTVTPNEIESGRKLFEAKGCFACHTAGNEPGGVVGPDLRLVRDRMKPGAIWFHIKSPHAVNAYSAEPDHGLTDEEVRALAAFLSTGER